MPDSSPIVTKPKVLILWADCKPVALALENELNTKLSGKCEAITIVRNGAGERAARISQEKIDEADLIVMLASDEDFRTNANAQDEFDYITVQVRNQKRSRSSFAFVKYQRKEPPEYPAANKLRLHFDSGVALNPDEIIEFSEWLKAPRKRPLLPIAQDTLNRSDAVLLLLDRFIFLDNRIWTVQADKAFLQDVTQHIFERLRFLKVLHSVHASPGPGFSGLLEVFWGNWNSQFTDFSVKVRNNQSVKGYDFNLIRSSLRHRGATAHFAGIQALIKEGFKPLLDNHARRLDEMDLLNEPAGVFMTDLLLRLNLIAKLEPNVAVKPRLSNEWIRGLQHWDTLLSDHERGFFVSPQDIEKLKKIGQLSLLTEAIALHRHVLLFATMIVAFFDLLRVQDALFETPEERLMLVEVLNSLENESKVFCCGAEPSQLADGVVRESNNLIIQYISAATSLR